MSETARIVSLPAQIESSTQPTEIVDYREDEFLRIEDFNPAHASASVRARRRTLAEIADLFRESRWEEALALFHSMEQKCPELVAAQQDADARAKIAFALGQVKRFDEAIQQLQVCLEREPNSFFHHSSLAYTAYNSIWAAKNRELFLAGKVRAERIELAHAHFRAAQALRPDGVTNYYRQGMLLRKIEGKNEKALPLFKAAVSNWEAFDEGQRATRHQEHKNYVKSLFQLASSLLEAGKARPALDLVKRCLAEDEASGHLSLVHKHFALGKVYFEMRQYTEARDALSFAAGCQADRPPDFVQELLARTWLALEDPRRALEIIGRVPEKIRKPYVRWTESDALCSLRQFGRARTVLHQAAERDPLGRHKTLIRLAKLEYLTRNYAQATEAAAAACRFYEEKYGNSFADGLFWQAASARQSGDANLARKLTHRLRECDPRHPKLGKLLEAVELVAKTVSGTK